MSITLISHTSACTEIRFDCVRWLYYKSNAIAVDRDCTVNFLTCQMHIALNRAEFVYHL